MLQVVRFLLTRRAEAQIRLLALDPEAPGGFRVRFEDDLAFRIDLADGGLRGLVPALGDWNGDGRLDFYLPRSDDEITFRLGAQQPGASLFEPASGRQSVPLAAGQSRAVDLDGDGLDEIVSFTTRDPDAPLVVLGNRGRLAGTRPTLTRAAD